MSPLSDKKIVVGISGGIAVYKTCELIRLLIKTGATVRVMATQNAMEFITPLTLETLSRNRLETTLWPNDGRVEPRHIDLARWADAILIAPATANLIAKLRTGIADDLLTSTMLAYPHPYLLAPAMNTAMWQHPATQENIKVLQERGVVTIGPDAGALAAANEEPGAGRMSEPAELLLALERHFDRSESHRGKKVLVVAGPTSEPIDAVRVITNRSTGTLGIAIAEQYHRVGASVTLLLGDTPVQPPLGIECHRFTTVASLQSLLISYVPVNELWVMVAAVSDRKPLMQSSSEKWKKSALGDALPWEPTPDLLATFAKTKRSDQLIIGFALEDHWDETEANRKRESKHCDWLVWNNPVTDDTGFGTAPLLAKLISETKTIDLGKVSRSELAKKIVSTCVME
ncbi:MAG: bifunctional phosphopantothenoylcysteine decarboxylase/phosphopantothenate--cysteine ligase CoaBC [bacterium]|nr:bifunctional phosphopantothenoylcysteine decarboxylase/phosphopantothenate--cysteine ligase CoaBC [bacterium]